MILQKLSTSLPLETAVARDCQGGTAFEERQLFRDSGLLKLFLPKQFGGSGQDWPFVLRAVREIAGVDSSLAHVLGFQHLILATLQLLGTHQQTERFLPKPVKPICFEVMP